MSKPLWSGRIESGLAPDAWQFLHSLRYDIALWDHDVLGSMAHVRTATRAGILTQDESEALLEALASMSGHPELAKPTDEDIHSSLERVLTERLGPTGAKVHAGRSRNDQVSTALRLWTRQVCVQLSQGTQAVVEALLAQVEATAELPMPGYTHMQRAQPVTVGHWLMAHATALARDFRRIQLASGAADVSTLGSGALATSTFEIDPTYAAQLLGFNETFANSMDAVADRDFLLDLSYACTSISIHISRLAEELVWFSSTEFGFIKLADEYSTGSSMMPQKRNPDVAEVARALPAQALGSLTALAMTLKGLPMAYNRDLQTDKQSIIQPTQFVIAGLNAFAGAVTTMTYGEDALRSGVADDLAMATDLAEGLVRAGVPFRDAHGIAASHVSAALDSGQTLTERVAAEGCPPLATLEALNLIDPAQAISRRGMPGGPGVASVSAQLAACRAALKAQQEWCSAELSIYPTTTSIRES